MNLNRSGVTNGNDSLSNTEKHTDWGVRKDLRNVVGHNLWSAWSCGYCHNCAHQTKCCRKPMWFSVSLGKLPPTDDFTALYLLSDCLCSNSFFVHYFCQYLTLTSKNYIEYRMMPQSYVFAPLFSRTILHN